MAIVTGMRVAIAFGVASFVALAFSACSLTDLDGLSSGGLSIDAGPLPSESGADGTSNDAGVDAAPDGPFCASRSGYAFCADFDQGNPPAPFDGVVVNGTGSSVAYDPSDFRSPPKSALFRGGLGGTFTAAGLTWKSKTITTEVVIDLDVRVIDLGKRPFDIIGFNNGSGGDFELEINELGVLQYDIDGVLPDGGDGTEIIPSTGILDTSWHHVTLRGVRNGADKLDVTASLDGVVVGTKLGTSASRFLGSPTLSIGDTDLEPTSTPWRVRMDNVLVNVK